MPTKKVVPEIPICFDYMDLKDLGSGFPLYYHLKKATNLIYAFMTMLFILFIIFDLNQDQDQGQGQGHEWSDNGDTSFIVYLSIGNYGKDENNYTLSNQIPVLMFNLILITTIINVT